ncbi:hypothetical protein [Flavobacterium sp. N2155]|uniref:hypothetical protein n=1 Tax=Flavobacterium sp. N2155 TaxID=2986830 RepID=UPI00222568C0|nr:hypothetical protein [Flavobacterium sp. N2155]
MVAAFSFSACCTRLNDDLPTPEPRGSYVAVLIVDAITNNFEGGKIYHYNQEFSTYNLTVENVPPVDVGYIKVHYVEANQLIYHATQVFMGNGEIIVPNPLKPPQDFQSVLTEDFFAFPNDAVELTNAPSPEGKAEEKWAQIQNLEVIRNALQQNKGSIHYFKHITDTGGFVEHAKWVFIVKN